MILPLIKRIGSPLISMTGDPSSALAQQADVNLDIGVAQEACPLGLAPTASTTVALALGDALAVALLESKGFSEEDFALSHPAGSLGRKLLLRIDDIMHKGDAIPRVPLGTTIADALTEMSQKSLGMTAVTNNDGKMVGIYTDGDLRRSLTKGVDVNVTRIDAEMSSGGKTLPATTLAAQAVKYMEDNKINGLIIVDETTRPIGALNMQDLLRHGVV